MNARDVAILSAVVALALVLGALGFQYIGGLTPCHMCHWQRWPLFAAIVTGFGAALLPSHQRLPVTLLTLALVAASGLIGAYQAGVEWGLLPGPTSCTGARFVLGSGALDLNQSMVRCDRPQILILGLSLAAYNALICLGTVLVGGTLLLKDRK